MNTFERLTEAELLAHFATIVDRERTTTADLIRCIIEIDLRKLWAKAACSSMFAFVTERFHLSEAAAGKRVQVARTAQRFPLILDMLADGTIHMSAVLMLAAHLTHDNHREVLSRASVITRAIEELLERTLKKKAAISTRPKAVVAKQKNAVSSLHEPAPKKPQTHANEHSTVESARAGEPAPSRAIPAETRREVFGRDGGRCAFQDTDGNRCQATKRIEFHHVDAFALGGAHTVTNLELRCQAHNQYEAERVYGVEFMRRKSGTREVREPLARYG